MLHVFSCMIYYSIIKKKRMFVVTCFIDFVLISNYVRSKLTVKLIVNHLLLLLVVFWFGIDNSKLVKIRP